ncbi:MAG: hypothetical protein Q7W45_17150 [Bacteroidota bacterium]|nr:hypothetical protein [Bacteroidota bacterium]MDP3145257.1 hypothetical protein [Bacteroidota bacterium]
MKKVFNIFLVLSFTTSLFFMGCRKKETVEVDNETQSAVDNAVADQEYMSIVPSVNGHAINTKGTGGNRMTFAIAPPCDTLTLISGDTLFTNPASYPVYTMNISSSACANTMPDGRVRGGKMQIKLTGKIKNAGSKMIITMINYNAAGISYSCDSMVVKTISSSTFATTFNVKLYKGVCQNANWNIKYELDRTITFYPKGNPVNTDPVAEIYGTTNGVNRVGKAFTVVIPQATPLVKHKLCKWIDKGIFELTPDGFKTRTVDFGDGTCDNKATFTVNGSTVAFTLN